MLLNMLSCKTGQGHPARPGDCHIADKCLQFHAQDGGRRRFLPAAAGCKSDREYNTWNDYSFHAHPPLCIKANQVAQSAQSIPYPKYVKIL